MAELVGEGVKIKASEHIVDSLCTCLTYKLFGIGVLELCVAWVFLIKVIEVVKVLLLGEDWVGVLL